jgi:hypothetical protein
MFAATYRRYEARPDRCRLGKVRRTGTTTRDTQLIAEMDIPSP